VGTIDASDLEHMIFQILEVGLFPSYLWYEIKQ
jgi:hypothetical protein